MDHRTESDRSKSYLVKWANPDAENSWVHFADFQDTEIIRAYHDALNNKATKAKELDMRDVRCSRVRVNPAGKPGPDGSGLGSVLEIFPTRRNPKEPERPDIYFSSKNNRKRRFYRCGTPLLPKSTFKKNSQKRRMQSKGKQRAEGGWPVQASSFFSPNPAARRVTEAEKRAFANMSKTGSSSQALQASGSSKRLHEEIDDDDNDGDEDQDQNQENQTSVTQSLLATSPAPAASTPTPLVAQLSSILNTQLSAQSAQSATSSRTVRPTSWVWNYFDKSKTVQKSNLGEGRFAYLCQVKMSEGRLCEKAITAETKSSTGALSKHLKESHGLIPPQPAAESNTPKRCKTVADFMQKRLQLPTDVNLETVRYMTLRAILCNNYPFRFVESPTVLQWATFFCPIAPRLLESATTYRTTVLKGTGFNVCVALVLKLMDLGLLSKLKSVTLDNASSNDTLVSFLHQIIDLWRSQPERSHLVPGVIGDDSPSVHHLRCLLHIINLAVVDAVSGLCGLSEVIGDDFDESGDEDFDEADNEETDPAYLEPADANAANPVDPAVISIMRTLAETLSMNHSTESDASLTSITSTAVPDDVRKLIKKAQAVARMLANSPALRDKLEKQCVAMNVSFRLLIQAVKTRWNSVYEMIDPLIHLWRPLNAVMLQVQPQQYAKYCSAFCGDSSMAFGDSDLRHFKALKVFLQPFYDATKRLSAGDTPTAHLVIPQFTSLCNQMKGIIDDVNPMWLRNGAQCALAKLEKYSDAICKCDGYIVATVLDPRHRLVYFDNHPYVRKDFVEERCKSIFAGYQSQSGNADPTSTGGNETQEADADPLFSAWISTPPVLIQPLPRTQQLSNGPIEVIATSEGVAGPGRTAKRQGRPPKNRANAPPAAPLHWDSNRIATLFRLKHETHANYFVEAKNKDHVHSGWVKVQDSFNTIYDTVASIDQLRNGYQRYLREYRKFVSVNLNETGNSKAPPKQE
ncbi:hypothetical protein BDR26DRAFT_916056 [Obelidium mucronatum]|nr:hypothetical protein BDR26DRAFT_916056 [Obelidium mucronatum]